MNSSKKDHKLTILGFCGGNIPVVAENAFDSLGITIFDIVKNIDVPDPTYTYLFDRFDFQIFEADSYDYSNKLTGVHFGVLDAHIKYILYHIFQQKHGIDKRSYTNLIHSSAVKAVSVDHINGLLMGPQSVVAPFSSLGFGVTIKRSASVGHHAKLGDFVNINPGAVLSGFVEVGEGTVIATGASIIHNVKIGKHTVIGAGSVVTNDIPDGVIAYGNPCKVIRENPRLQKSKKRLDAMLSESD
jgi:UDP-3-O-[3-hydroxymyristoyl] glucosamine N-acyltransferase